MNKDIHINVYVLLPNASNNHLGAAWAAAHRRIHTQRMCTASRHLQQQTGRSRGCHTSTNTRTTHVHCLQTPPATNWAQQGLPHIHKYTHNACTLPPDASSNHLGAAGATILAGGLSQLELGKDAQLQAATAAARQALRPPTATTHAQAHHTEEGRGTPALTGAGEGPGMQRVQAHLRNAQGQAEAACSNLRALLLCYNPLGCNGTIVLLQVRAYVVGLCMCVRVCVGARACAHLCVHMYVCMHVFCLHV